MRVARSGRINIKEWARGLERAGLLSNHEREELIKANEEKERFLSAWNLPQYRYYGVSKTPEGIGRIIKRNPPQQRYWLRCIPDDQRIPFRSFVDVSSGELIALAKKCARTSDFSFQIIECWKGTHAGTVIISKGVTVVELWSGDHLDGEKRGCHEFKHARADFRDGATHLAYSQDASPAERAIMLSALRYFSPQVKRSDLLDLEIYADFIWRKDKGHVFLDGSDARFWTRI